MKFRHLFLVGMFLLWPLLIVLTDPQTGALRGLFSNAAMAGMLVYMLALGSKMMGLLLAFWAYKAFRDYPESDNQKLFQLVRTGNVAAGHGLVSNAIVLAVLIFVFCYAMDATVPAAFGPASGGLEQ